MADPWAGDLGVGPSDFPVRKVMVKVRKKKNTPRYFKTVALAVSVVERYKKWSGGMFPPPSEYSIDCFVENTLHDQTKEYQAKARGVLARLIRKS